MQVFRSVLGFLLANWYKFVLLGLIITMIVMVSIHGFSIFGSILHWFKRRNGWGGWGVFIGFYAGVVALFMPGVVFILGSGFIFGFWRGLLAVWIGGAVGQALAFLLARYLLRDWVETFVRTKWRKWKFIDAAIENEGWKLVLIMRLSPIIPYNLLNIAMATTSMHFWQFTIVSAIGIVFECSVFCYLGTMAESITSIASGEAGPPKAIQWVLLGVSLTMCVVGAVFVSVMVRRAIRKAEEMSASAVDLSGEAAEEGEGEALLLATPSTLEREGFIRSIPGLSKLSEARDAIFKLHASSLLTAATPEKTAAPAPGLISVHLRSTSKAKMSPRAVRSGASTPKKAINEGRERDLEMGTGPSPMPMSASRRANRRTASRVENEDFDGGGPGSIAAILANVSIGSTSTATNAESMNEDGERP